MGESNASLCNFPFEEREGGSQGMQGLPGRSGEGIPLFSHVQQAGEGGPSTIDLLNQVRVGEGRQVFGCNRHSVLEIQVQFPATPNS